MPASLLVNPARRAAIKTGCLGAMIAAGPDKARSGYGNGDAVLVLPRRRLFVVADAAERFPSGSRLLLERVVRRTESHAPRDLDAWIELMNAAYANQNYNHKTTLSAAAVIERRGALSLALLHGGDSPIIVVNRSRERIEFTSAVDMNFAGRSSRLGRGVEFPLGADDYTVIIASDGIADLARMARMSVPRLAREVIASRPPDELPDTVARLLGKAAADHNHDDLAVIVFDPKQVRPGRSRPLVLGGTTPAEEAAFRKRLAEGVLPDRWIRPVNLPKI